jgi:hypothetical protein
VSEISKSHDQHVFIWEYSLLKLRRKLRVKSQTANSNNTIAATQGAGRRLATIALLASAEQGRRVWSMDQWTTELLSSDIRN